MSIAYANYENYAELTSQDFVIVDFFTDTCGPCKLFAKILENIEFDMPFVNIVKVNLSHYPKIGMDYNVEAVPTILFMKNGEIKEREEGTMEKEEVIEKISKYYY
ncbi:MAG: thioredoxin family protein [Intestinibacter sp.]|uniref:thioredoxin family protein n=1 Tax=Intestinibacter sp. TaxID=1965304 RepID=UPI003F175B09